MKLFTMFPLRITLPVLLLSILIIINGYSMVHNKRLSDAEVENSGMIFVTQDMSQLQGSVNNLMQKGDVEGIKIVIANRGSNPDVALLLLADENSIVLDSTSMKLQGLSLIETVPDIDMEMVNHVRETMSGKVSLSSSRDYISACFPITLAAVQKDLRPGRTGMLFMRYDLLNLKVTHRRQIERQILFVMGVYFVMFLFIGYYLHAVITKRVMRLVTATQKFSSGDLSARAALSGRDELAQIGQAFDYMVDKIAADRQELKSSKERYRSIFEGVPDAIFISDIETGKILDFNPAACRLLERSREEIAGMFQPQLHPPGKGEYYKGSFNQRMQGTEQHENIHIIDNSIVRSDGTETAVEIMTQEVILNNRKVLQSVFRDIAERRKSEEEILRLNEKLEERVHKRTLELDRKSKDLQESQQALMNIVEDLNIKTEQLEQANIRMREIDQLKSMFIASMSHELRTPLNSIIGFSSVMFEGWTGALNDEQKENIAIVLKAGKHLLSLINDIIDISKIETGKIEAFSEDFDLDDLISEAVVLIKKELELKGIELQVESMHITMHSDRRRLFQCMVNLLSNAIKFTEKGRVSISARPGPGEEKDFIEITVADTGIGIREEDMQKLFLPFVCIPSPLSMKAKGSGLGLYLVHKIAKEILKGEVTAKSVYGEGSIFCLKIPVML